MHLQVSRSYGKEALGRDVARLRQMNKQLEQECVLANTDKSRLSVDLR